MIGHLKGVVTFKDPPHLIIDVQGVGYELLAPTAVFYALPETEQVVHLYTHQSIREDAHQLFGFVDRHTRDLFRILIKVNGVGPKVALAILSGLSVTQIVAAVHQKEITPFTAISGVGKKTAERILLDTRSVLADWTGTEASNTAPDHPFTDTIAALVSLGYKPLDAKRMVEQVYDATLSQAELLRQALKTQMKRVPA